MQDYVAMCSEPSMRKKRGECSLVALKEAHFEPMQVVYCTTDDGALLHQLLQHLIMPQQGSARTDRSIGRRSALVL